MVEITALNIYPVKSLHGIALDTATLGTRGFRFDRQWLVVDHRNFFVTQRALAGMATITPHLTDEALILRHPDQPDLVIPLHKTDGPRVRVKIWKDWCDANEEGNEASTWLTSVLGQFRGHDLRLVRFASDGSRPVEPDFLAGDKAETAFADGYPYLVTVEESLADLNEHLRKCDSPAVPMNRFRANIVVRGLEPLAENRVDELTHAKLTVRLALRKPCQRCRITTVDQETGVASSPPQPGPDSLPEPLRTLVAQNPFPGKPGGYFGQNAILLDGENQQLTVGDELVASYRPPAIPRR
ncbi:MAG: MOSC domain-containing protein [Gammaproteobacteria bacterium]|nr:MOSC domain-containing protein [Gammaproteobacteria bacterium]